MVHIITRRGVARVSSKPFSLLGHLRKTVFVIQIILIVLFWFPSLKSLCWLEVIVSAEYEMKETTLAY